MTEHDDEDDVTIWAGRLRAWPAPDPDAVLDAPVEDLDDATALRSRRALAPPDPAPLPEPSALPEATALGARRAVRAAQPVTPDPAPASDGRRVARVPDAAAREIYRPRSVQPEIAQRSAPPPRERQHPVGTDPDTLAAAAAARARRARRRWVAIALVGAALIVLVVAAAALVLALG